MLIRPDAEDGNGSLIQRDEEATGNAAEAEEATTQSTEDHAADAADAERVFSILQGEEADADTMADADAMIQRLDRPAVTWT